MDKPDTPRENPALLDERIKGEAARPELENQVPDRPQATERTKPHDAGSDANDTVDGLTESEEAIRQAAEDIPTGQDPAGSSESVPVFERGSLPPKV
ncbi:hypothetical protein [Bosea sp. BK604]|uniref:hypothetical protein n=1 Tax=Bosea sp. BK604 TaxID=2512180 RepID=UPI00104C672D|nr:hypothetical protein [Bosea sp. BK604]TCR61677.1 hypothetical protein EV560_11216 [Bosea sp. BK604]